MTKRNETTSNRVAKTAAKALRDPKASKREKSLAGSALTQKVRRKRVAKSHNLRELHRAVMQAWKRYVDAVVANVRIVVAKPKAKRKA